MTSLISFSSVKSPCGKDTMFNSQLAADALRANGWTDSTGPLPMAKARFWRRGWEVVGAACRRFHHVGRGSDLFSRELLILPTSFVGLDPSPCLEGPEFLCLDDNTYSLSAKLMLTTIIRTILLHRSAQGVRLLMGAWASYFYEYCGFNHSSLDDAEPEIREWWKANVEDIEKV